MLNAHPVREPSERPPGTEEISIFSGAVQGSGIVIDVVVDVLAVGVGGDEKGMVALRPAQGRFVTHPVRLLGGDLPRLKRLPDLIAQHVRVPFLFPARDGFVLGLGKQELRVGGHVVALIGGDQFTALGLVGILPVLKAAFEGAGDGFPLLIWWTIRRVVAVAAPPFQKPASLYGNHPHVPPEGMSVAHG